MLTPLIIIFLFSVGVRTQGSHMVGKCPSPCLSNDEKRPLPTSKEAKFEQQAVLSSCP